MTGRCLYRCLQLMSLGGGGPDDTDVVSDGISFAIPSFNLCVRPTNRFMCMVVMGMRLRLRIQPVCERCMAAMNPGHWVEVPEAEWVVQEVMTS